MSRKYDRIFIRSSHTAIRQIHKPLKNGAGRNQIADHTYHHPI